ncbi:2-oxoglutarate dehydrogenase E1 component [Paenibacillus tarimensis]|uniref:2-oxoglutarate dehydrogenase E1 component n=1 Tax=Paenibacillus tarimensis TaxID=416012 RepID=UPI001F2678F0|nr:2-oxoglutarate dehydrogenase E1 component [Paenibacillus tarimensis]MCF2942632.1 2-oxoglutarate dehydrogenase E1 component [Paenibacillus tarimensis]
MSKDSRLRAPWEQYAGPNIGYLLEQYERYTQDPSSVAQEYRDLFDQYGEPPFRSGAAGAIAPSESSFVQQPDANLLKKIVAAGKIVWNIRTYGHLAADIDPLGLQNTAPDTRLLDPETYGLSRADLDSFPATWVWEEAPERVKTGWDAISHLRAVYTGRIAYEFSHVHEQSEREWLMAQAESDGKPEPLSNEERCALLKRIVEVEEFERFLHRTFAGQKRFSLEGTDMLVPMVDEIVRRSAGHGAEHMLMGMAHRGRLNVLAHVLGKPYGAIFSEFHHSPNKDMIPSEGSMGINFGWTGDVKYHLGGSHAVKPKETVQIRVTLAHNPSHLEFVNPVVEGFTRAAQEDRTKPGYPEQDVDKAVTVLVHGDAAFAGEGVVAETLNFNQLTGYRNGGTVHIIANNRLGFTTDSKDARSTYYASDLAKGYEIPIIHVNADDPEACINAIRMACDYRAKFRKDFLIDLIGYRRYGHNEMDDPDATQPLMYQKVRSHPTVSNVFAEKLLSRGLIEEDHLANLRQEVQSMLQQTYEVVKQNDKSDPPYFKTERLNAEIGTDIVTAVPLERLKAINEELLRWPDNFHVYPKLRRILERRAVAFNEGEKVDWALAEIIAFATILEDGVPIRMSGQDSERGTFAHRHIVLHDSETGEVYCPLHRIPQARASFAIHNSPLSEAAVLGFEYGYNVFSPETLVIWEAQYGDFGNAAQVIIDQFIAASRVKWSQRSGLVMLLPHGHEGQGPEHSSARLERYLQLAGDNNWTVANLTKASQYFHLLRKQAGLTKSPEMRPLILMAPKSLIRNPRVASTAAEFTEGTFLPVIEHMQGGDDSRVERLILCSGKVTVDILDAIDNAQGDHKEWLRVVSVEQLYPFPEEKVQAIIDRYPNLSELIWMQEEPGNMGAWTFARPYLQKLAPGNAEVRYIGRPDRSSPASGYQYIHSFEQDYILKQALRRTTTESMTKGR